jgi:hypothetical protein
MASPVIQIKRGLLANLPGLRVGEPGFTTDSYDLYVGLTSETATNKIVGSARFWTNNTSSTGSGVNLVEGTSNGTSYITLKAPDSLAGIVTYTMPGSDGSNGQVLATNGSGTLSFIDAAANLSLAGDTGTDTVALLTDTLTFAGTANEIETTVTNNQVQIGLPNSVTIGDALTVTGALTANGNVTLGNAGGDLVTVVGLTTFTTSDVYVSNQLYVGGLQVTGGASIGEDITTRHFRATGVSTFVGSVTFEGGTINLGDSNTDDINVAGEFISNLVPNTDATYDIGDGASSKSWRNASFSGIGTFASGAVVDAVQIGISGNSEIDTSSGVLTLDSAAGQVVIDDHLSVTGVTTITGFLDANDGADIFGQVELDSVNVATALTSANLKLASGVTITAILDEDNFATNSDTAVPTQQSVKAYVDAQVTAQDLDFAGDTGTGAVDLDSQTFTIAGTANEVNTSASGQTITIGLPDNVTIAGDLTVSGNDIKDSGGNAALTFDGSQNVTANQNLTVSGNLYVNGSTTQVNTASITVEDRTIELGLVDGSAPSSATTWDLGVLFNYNSSGAKKSGVIWEHGDGRFKFGSQVTDGGGTDNNSPQVTVSNYAAIEIGGLWVNDCAGQSQVINCTGSTRTLENITIDGGSF